MNKLHENGQYAYKLFSQIPGLRLRGSADSPVFHLCLTREQRAGSREADNRKLQKISEALLDEGVSIPRARYINGEKYQPPPSLRLCISADHTKEHIEKGFNILKQVAATHL